MDRNEYLKMRSLFLQLEIGSDQKPVWVKQLKNILNYDIHEKPLGCKISNTHIKVGNVHLESFYEAEVLFSHHYWINCFSKWLEDEIEKVIGNSREIIIIGYETFLEPVLFLLHDYFNEVRKINLFYGIYEEPKYTQNLGYAKTGTNIKFLDSLNEIITVSNSTPIIFICGISTTLNTFREMHNKLCEERPDLKENDCYRFSLIQVLPANPDRTKGNREIKSYSGSTQVLTNVFSIEKTIKFDFYLFANSDYVYSETLKNDKRNVKKTDSVLVKYLVSSESEWHPAHECKLCNLSSKNGRDNIPIIKTSETSVVPSQMIKSPWYKHSVYPKEMSKINLFEEVGKNKQFVFQEYLYYGHIDRMDHHFIYYLRSAHMIKAILDGKYPDMKQRFEQICTEIKNSIHNDNVIDIIVSPSESGDEVFPCAINRYVFDNKAHTLSLDPNKEFRSNFCTKFSNFGYILDQIKKWKGDTTPTIRFHYVSKHLIATETFNRVKSLIESLMQIHNLSKEDADSKRILSSIEIFSSVIIFLSRNSLSSKYNYISDADRYFSFIDIDIPSIRYYGDACPMCKLSQDVNSYKKACVLQKNAVYWEKKEESYIAKSTEVAKEKTKDRSIRLNKELNARYFRRFYFENELYKNTKGSIELADYKKAMLNVLRGNKKHDVESVISFVKVISSPFLYYQENEKKAALGFILEITKQFISNSSLNEIVIHSDDDNPITATFKNDLERYSLLVICLNCLSKIDSTYLLSVETISKLLDAADLLKIKNVDGVYINPNQFDDIIIKKDQRLPGFLSCIVNNCKRILCGISGDAKKYFFEEELKKYISIDLLDSSLPLNKVLMVLYFENTEPEKPSKKEYSDDMFKKYGDIVSDIIDKVSTNNKKIKDKVKLTLLYCRKTSETELGIEPFDNTFWKNNNRNNILEKVKACLENPVGFYVDLNSCIVILSSEKGKMILLHISTKEYKVSIDEKLFVIRKFLRYSTFLREKIQPDLENNLIQFAFQADDAHQLISTGKLISHNGFHDTTELSKITNFLINRWTLTTNKTEQDELFVNACRSIHSFMNRCIGFGSITRYVEKYGKIKENELNPKLIFLNSWLPLMDDENYFGDTGFLARTKDFLIKYFVYALNPNSPYWNMLEEDYPKKHIKSITVIINGKKQTINDDNAEKLIVSPLSRVNVLPKFLNSASFDEDYAWIFLWGILDTLLRNVPEHSNDDYSFTFKFDYTNFEYSFEIENGISQKSRNKTASGQTQGFFDFINGLEAAQDGSFEVNMNPKDKTESHTAKVTIKRKTKEVQDG